jgi:hypothetical protein
MQLGIPIPEPEVAPVAAGALGLSAWIARADERANAVELAEGLEPPTL